jgi:ELWxxDGT repeat protein
MISNLARDAAPSSDPRDLVAAGDWVYFDAWDGSGPFTLGNAGQHSMWRSDGTPEGTLRIRDEPASNSISDGHTLYFTSSNELWTSDGTPEGTTAAAFPSNFQRSRQSFS